MTTHDEAVLALPELALDALDGAELQSVLAHVRACDACRMELEQLRESTSLAALIVPQRKMAARSSLAMRERLVSRAGSQRDAAGGPAKVLLLSSPHPVDQSVDIAAMRRPPKQRNVMRWMAIAASTLLVASLAQLYSMVLERSQLRDQIASIDQRNVAFQQQVAAMDRRMGSQGAMIEALTGRGVRVVNLSASGAREPVARMFWDRTTNQWTMVGHDLPQPAIGRTYQLWLVTADGSKISAGTFRPTATGDAVMQATYALAPSALKAIAVTEEPMGGVPQPTGKMVIAGNA